MKRVFTPFLCEDDIKIDKNLIRIIESKATTDFISPLEKYLPK